MSEPKLDTSRPSSARVWNYLLGGKDHFEIDRIVGDQVRESLPEIVVVAQEQRKFLSRAVTWLAGEAGIRQFLDIGTGLPVAENTHQVAQRVAPDARAVYVDNDPLVLVHARALLTGTAEGSTDYVDSDVEDPAKILREAARTLDFSRPVALTMLGILGNVADYAEARSIVERLLAAVPPGSYLMISDGTNTSPGIVEGQRKANQSGHPYNLRSPEQIAGFFEGLELVEPGVVSIPHWRPIGEAPPAMDGYCGVARKP
ncbi:SAM-dependent methyltransferase [Paractinoplanes lichenicola]|uniref:SAM-dependent methyltransferase n=1 Tax=Paractinoplanes lichenicola TaxID=2802976 RepID=A0ABS1VLZ9_9ACTN|nr:SAM-dependent methyltransferase [Actinoplanes lichenicola]MBL7255628.1 SAM-dependent methyltransferase [Actinoplanes lichenicola]